ncbi:MAG: transporter substrate-binding domain-containing protein [Paludibacteraceae bacterium]|nr:transporter substrate-binding domain-containing protein [Paludibacteraceae bacterium]
MKKWLIYSLTAALLAALSIVFFTRHAEIKDFSAILKSGRITVLTDSSSLGFSVLNDSVGGFQYEIFKAFANKYGLELIISINDNTEEGINELISGESQLLAHFIPSNKENLERLLLTKAFFTTELVLVQKSDSANISSQQDLSGDTVFVAEGSVFIPRIKNLANELSSDITIVELKNKSLEQLVELVAQGKIKYTVCPGQLALIFNSRFSNLNTSLAVGFQQEYGWAVHPGSSELRDSLNSFLSEYIGSSAYWEIYMK